MALTLYVCAKCQQIVGCVFIGNLCRFCKLSRDLGGELSEAKPQPGIRLVLPDNRVVNVNLTMDGEWKDTKDDSIVTVRPARKFRLQEA